MASNTKGIVGIVAISTALILAYVLGVALLTKRSIGHVPGAGPGLTPGTGPARRREE